MSLNQLQYFIHTSLIKLVDFCQLELGFQEYVESLKKNVPHIFYAHTNSPNLRSSVQQKLVASLFYFFVSLSKQESPTDLIDSLFQWSSGFSSSHTLLGSCIGASFYEAQMLTILPLSMRSIELFSTMLTHQREFQSLTFAGCVMLKLIALGCYSLVKLCSKPITDIQDSYWKQLYCHLVQPKANSYLKRQKTFSLFEQQHKNDNFLLAALKITVSGDVRRSPGVKLQVCRRQPMQ